MLQAVKTKRGSRQQIANTHSLPAPIGGWNARDSLALMKETEAAALENWFPTTTDLQLRKGYTIACSGLSGTTQTIMAYNPPGAATALFAVTSAGDLYDITSGTASLKVFGLANGQWQYISFGTSAGNYLLAANGSDNMLRYDGTRWISIALAAGVAITGIVGGGVTAVVTTATPHGLQTGNNVTIAGCTLASAALNGSYQITKLTATTFSYLNGFVGPATGAPTYTVNAGEFISGIDPKSIITLNAFKQRIWLITKNSLSAWYMGAASIAGAATEFPLSSFFLSGGLIKSMATWTIDVGVGIDDNAVFISSEGEVLVYKGTDPTAPATFALVGLFRMGNPVGTRCQIKYLGDVYVITDSGVSPLSSSILTAQVTLKSDLSDKIQLAISAAISLTKTTFGWQLIPYPSQNMLIVNAPASGMNYQFAMNTITGAWCKFTGWNASCWESQGANIYFGYTGGVALAWSSTTDNGSSIIADVLPAFNYFGARGRTKHFKAARPTLITDGVPTLLGSMNVDYDTTAPTGSLSYVAPSSGMVWGSMVWGSMIWGGQTSIQKGWQYAGGVGYCGSFHFKCQNNGSNVRWESIDYLEEEGGVIG